MLTAVRYFGIISEPDHKPLSKNAGNELCGI